MDWQPSERKLRQFAICCLVLLPAVAWWWSASTLLMAIVVALSAACVLLAWLAPQLVRPLYIGISLVALPIGWLVGEILLVVIYFGIFCPIGLAFRAIGRDSLRLKWDRSAESYWEDAQGEESVGSYYRRY